MPQLAERLFSLIAVALALACVWSGIDALLHQTAYQNLSAAVAFASALVLAVSAAVVWFNLRGRRALAIVSGSFLALFTISSVTLGRSDLDGVADILTIVASGVAAILAFILGGKRRNHDAT